MKRSYYIFNSGRLRRKDNTIYFEPFASHTQFSASGAGNSLSQSTTEQAEKVIPNEILEEILLDIPDPESENPAYSSRDKKAIPIDDIDSFMIFGEVNFNARFLNFLSQKQISAHIYNHYGFYAGSYYPREYLLSGFLLVKQVEHYTSKRKRITIARKLIEGAAFNMLKNCRYYNSRNVDLAEEINAIEILSMSISTAEDVPTLMAIEGNIRQKYYSCFQKILGGNYDFEKRVKNPPDNAVNALISFTNSLVYTACLSELYRTQLNPLISYLHEPGERRFSFALDISEIFKPLIADRILFKLLNTKMINHKDFDSSLNFCYLKESARKVVVKEFEDKMTTTIEHRKLKKKVSYRRLIRLECYKIVKHLIGEGEYDPFKIWW